MWLICMSKRPKFKTWCKEVHVFSLQDHCRYGISVLHENLNRNLFNLVQKAIRTGQFIKQGKTLGSLYKTNNCHILIANENYKNCKIVNFAFIGKWLPRSQWPQRASQTKNHLKCQNRTAIQTSVAKRRKKLQLLRSQLQSKWLNMVMIFDIWTDRSVQTMKTQISVNTFCSSFYI